METFSALLTLCARNSPVTDEFHAQRPVTRSFDVFFDLRVNKRLSEQSWGWWFETPARSLWRHCNSVLTYQLWSSTGIVNALVPIQWKFWSLVAPEVVKRTTSGAVTKLSSKWRRFGHWPEVVTETEMVSFWRQSLAALQVVILTISGAPSDVNFVNMTTFGSENNGDFYMPENNITGTATTSGQLQKVRQNNISIPVLYCLSTATTQLYWHIYTSFDEEELHYNGITYASWRLTSLETRLFVQHFIRLTTKNQC